jgi:hypothetical protein
MSVITKLAQIRNELAPYVEKVSLKGHESASFLYVVNKGWAVEISEDNGGFWLEFWARSDDEDAVPVKEMTVESSKDAVQNAMVWLR